MQHVAIIGTGGAGLAALRSLGRHLNNFTICAYEQSDRVGGTWIYNDKFKPTSMFRNLKTNLPKELMEYPGFPYSEKHGESFLHHSSVLQYQESFAKHYDLKKDIKFLTKVIQVKPSHTTCSKKWSVEAQVLNGETFTENFDAVIVCNGHFTKQRMPKIPGFNNFQGRIYHSHLYRTPEECQGQRVMILGAGPSGIDIALDLASHAKKVLLSHNKPVIQAKLPENVVQVSCLERLTQTEAVLKDGQSVEIDQLLCATGYVYDFPFMDDSCKPLISNQRVLTAYRGIVDVNYPTIFCIGLNQNGVLFPSFHYQAEFVSAVLRGVYRLPSVETMKNCIRKDYQERTVAQGKPERKHHDLGTNQWDYFDKLAQDSCVKPFERYIRVLYKHVEAERMANAHNFQKQRYRITGSESFEQIF